MNIECFNNHNKPYLRLVASLGLKKVAGRYVHRRKTVLNLGPLDRLDDGKPDFLRRLRESFRAGTPIVESLAPFVGECGKKKVTVTFEVGDAKCLGDPKRMAATILDPVFAALGLDEFFASVKHASKISYDLQGIVRLLAYGRILEPASKSATMDQNGKWYAPPVKSANDDNVYDALTVIARNRERILRRMNTCVTRGTGRKADVVFYDVTNFFFEIPEADPDSEKEVVGEGGSKAKVTVRGLRKYGVSKENRRQPIVQTGLFLDDQGIPLSIEEFPGNTLDAQTLRTAMKKTVGTFDMGRFILVADRGMYSGTNMQAVREGGNGYIVSKSLLKSTAKEREWAVGPKGWEVVREDFKCKSDIVTRTVKDENGNVVKGPDGTPKTYEEKVVVYWSESFYRRQVHENKSFLEFVAKLRANPAGFRATAAESRSLRKFLKKDVVNAKTGEVLDGTKLRAMIDDEKLDAFKDLMGYYQIVSSETKMPSTEIIEKYHGLTRIEDQFREMKGTLETRPVYVRTPEHIRAHLMVCFIALTMLRLIQRKTKAVVSRDPDVKWSYGIPGARVAAALREWKVDELPGDYYRMQDATGEDIRAILKAYGIEIQPKIYTKGEIREIKSTVNPY